MNKNLIEIKKCEVCDGTELIEVLNLGSHPMCDDLVELNSERVCREFPVEILFCSTCRTAHQKYQIPKAELFPKTYHYRSRFTADVLNGMKALVQDSKKFVTSYKDKKVIDIGCNDGSLLDFFRDEGATTIGIEPTNAYKDAVTKGHHTYNEFLTVETANKVAEAHSKFDVITFTNVFAHIEDLKGVIESLKVLMKIDTVIIIENHYLGAVMDRNQFDTFYHEHPRTYSYESFVFIAKSLDLDLINVEFPSRYGGNIRVMMGKKSIFGLGNTAAQEIIDKEKAFIDRFKQMKENIEVWRKNKKTELETLVLKYGPLKAKAFPGRAAILVKLLELNTDIISATFEKPGSMKIGYYLPGTRIPIYSDDVLFETIRNEKIIVNFAWHIAPEIEKYLNSNGFKGELINIL